MSTRLDHHESLQIIKQDDNKFFSRLLSKESSRANSSCRDRVLYYGGASGAVPFVWESQPGTPKHHNIYSSHHEASLIPPLTPPPSYNHSNSKKNHNHSSSWSSSSAAVAPPSKPATLLISTILFPKKKISHHHHHHMSPSSSVSSWSSSSSWSSPPSYLRTSSVATTTKTGHNVPKSRTRRCFSSSSRAPIRYEVDDYESPTSTLCFTGGGGGKYKSWNRWFHGCYPVANVMKSALLSIVGNQQSGQGARA